MSRRRGEFEHRTSIFEGAYRAWSHLGGLEPGDLESKSASDLDPLDYPLIEDERLSEDKRLWTDEEGISHKFYFYEPLPRAGLGHPYVQAILSPWLGPEADQDAIQLGLTTLRTWWQHRRKGESPSAVVALSTEKMRNIVEGYTRHFFNLAYCLIVNDKEQGPRTLATKMKALEKFRKKNKRKRNQEEEAQTIASAVAAYTSEAAPAATFDSNSNLTPLEKLHAAQRRQLAESGGITVVGQQNDITSVPLVNMKGKCVPGKLDLPGVVEAVSHHASQLAHRGAGVIPNQAPSSSSSPEGVYGDPNTTPVVFVSENGDIQIAMSVDGITCAHCVKIVETVLKGCGGNKSPIDGLLDAAADRVLCQVLIKIDRSSSAKRIAFEAARNLSMVGYTAKVKEMSIVNSGGDKKATMDLGALSTAFEVVATTDPKDVFDWTTPCSCPDNGVLRDDCQRHSQMNTRIFEAFETREQQVKDYMAGCGQKYGMPCTCGPDCRCKNCEEHCAQKNQQQEQQDDLNAQEQILREAMEDPTVAQLFEQHMAVPEAPVDPNVFAAPAAPSPEYRMRARNSIASRNPSLLSFGGLRRMSLTSDATFGRAMSGLSALSIDWENMEDFDVNVDHSAHINNNYVPYPHGTAKVPTDGIEQNCNMMTGGECNCGPSCLCAGCPIHDTSSQQPSSTPPRPVPRSSIMRRVAPAPQGDADTGNGTGLQVSFQV